MRKTDLLRATLAAGLLVGGTGCTVIPVGGPAVPYVAQGRDSLTKPFHRMVAIEPQPDWTPEQTIRGLQAAMAAYPDDPATLQKYLTPEARATWQPTSTVVVLENAFEVGDQDPRDTDETVRKVQIVGTQAAVIEHDDTYRPAERKETIPFTLVKDPKGGYRVSSMPDGLLLTVADVARAYRPTKLYYVAGDRLVADRVWLRLKAAQPFAQTIIERLLNEPSSALVGAVGSGFMPGTKVESVRSGEDNVVINLKGPVGFDRRQEILAQLQASLYKNDIANGRTIEVHVNGEPYATDKDIDPGWLDNDSGDAYYQDKGALHRLPAKADEDGPLVGYTAGKPDTEYTDFALAKRSIGLVAAKGPDGISVTSLNEERPWQQVIQGDKLTPPTWHRDGTLWTFDQRNGVVLRWDPEGVRRVSAPGVAGLNVTRLRIARDGVRVAVTKGDTLVEVGALALPSALMIGNVRQLFKADSGETIRDVAWRDGERLLVLTKSNAGPNLLEINVGDGSKREIPLKDDLRSLAAMPDMILAEAKPKENKDGGVILEFIEEQQSWTPRSTANAHDPVFPLG
ncbi:hypothetical protein HII36_23410 [Nonomuraea sp. NN258]|uniref:LpqB family beta-propeller domain-containing protein n=1 Tax=Nonomuraea antri TaxID=2730852 RepID=UPI0015687DAF|nr:LpqB family beta-propeller domain-containing protein [Nonomuraea antri]NRQ34758.1 hypothetical protein [Nonomuraea antri]